MAIVTGAALLAGGGALAGYSLREPISKPTPQPIPGPTVTVIRTEKVQAPASRIPSLPISTPVGARPLGDFNFPDRRALIPQKAKLEKLRRIPASADSPQQIVVTWRFGPSPLAIARGLLLWQFDETYGRRGRWRVTFGIHQARVQCLEFDADPGRRLLRFECTESAATIVGAPDRERIEDLFCSYPHGINFSLRDVTADGHKDVVVTEGGCGSGGISAWRVLATIGGETRQVLRTDPGSNLAVKDSAIRVSRGVFRQGDGAHCPSLIRTATWVWNGTEFVRVGLSFDESDFEC